MISVEARLGKAFSYENLKDLRKSLDDYELPIIPYDVTIAEIEVLLAYQGNMLAYLQANLTSLSMAESKSKILLENTYNEVYQSIYQQSADKKTATLKAITKGNRRVVAAQEDVLKIQETKALLEARILALQEQNISLRKIATIKGIAIERGLE